MKNNTILIGVNREILHSLLYAIVMVRLKGSKINQITSGPGMPIEVSPGMIVVEKKVM